MHLLDDVNLQKSVRFFSLVCSNTLDFKFDKFLRHLLLFAYFLALFVRRKNKSEHFDGRFCFFDSSPH